MYNGDIFTEIKVQMNRLCIYFVNPDKCFAHELMSCFIRKSFNFMSKQSIHNFIV